MHTRYILCLTYIYIYYFEVLINVDTPRARRFYRLEFFRLERISRRRRNDATTSAS